MRHFVLAPSTGQDSHVLCKHRKSYVFFCDCHTKRRCSQKCSYSEWHLLYFLYCMWKLVEEHMKSEAEEKQILERDRMTSNWCPAR